MRVNLTTRILLLETKVEIVNYLLTEKDINEVKLSSYLSGKLKRNFGHISNQFKKYENISIYKYVQIQKTRLIENMLSDGLSGKEIMHKLNFSSPAHLSKFFKRNSGLKMMEYKKQITS